MNKNIFESAKFGDKFLTRDGRIAIYLNQGTLYNSLAVKCENDSVIFVLCNDNGDNFSKREDLPDIVSRYKESIDEEKLDELARSIYKEKKYLEFPTEDRVTYFKVGYRKAMEE